VFKAAISAKIIAVAVAFFGLQLVCFCCSWPLFALNVKPVATPGRTLNDYAVGKRAAFPEWKGTPFEAPGDYYFGIVWKLDCSSDAEQGDKGAALIGQWLCRTPLAGIGDGQLGVIFILLLIAATILAPIVLVRFLWALLFRWLPGLVGWLWRLLRRVFSHVPAWKIIPGVAPRASSPQLQSVFRELFRPTDLIPGGTAGAIRYELQTGRLIGGRSHIRKGIERARQLAKIIREGHLSVTDQATAQAVLDDLLDALKLGGFTL
jgi:hypothetical protein